jgi:hypothetical protein
MSCSKPLRPFLCWLLAPRPFLSVFCVYQFNPQVKTTSKTGFFWGGKLSSFPFTFKTNLHPHPWQGCVIRWAGKTYPSPRRLPLPTPPPYPLTTPLCVSSPCPISSQSEGRARFWEKSPRKDLPWGAVGPCITPGGRKVTYLLSRSFCPGFLEGKLRWQQRGMCCPSEDQLAAGARPAAPRTVQYRWAVALVWLYCCSLLIVHRAGGLSAIDLLTVSSVRVARMTGRVNVPGCWASIQLT